MNYLKITEEMLALGLKPNEILVFARINGFGEKGCYESIENIAKFLRISYSSVIRALKVLKEKGLIKVEHKTKYGTIKYLTTLSNK